MHLDARQTTGPSFVFSMALVRQAEVQACHRHIEAVALGVLQGEELPFLVAQADYLQPQVATHAVVDVHHRRPGAQLGEVADDRLAVPLAHLASYNFV